MKFLVTFRPNWWIIGAIFEEICIYVEENEGFGQPLIPFILLIGELQMGPYMVTYWCVSECCSLIGSHRLYVYRNEVICQIATLFLKFWCLNTLIQNSLSEKQTIMSTNISSKKHLQNMAEKLCRCTHCKDI